jgi:hypothetical protein
VSRNVFKAVLLGDPEVSRADIVRGLAGLKSSGLASPGVASASEVAVDAAFGGGKRTLVMRDVPEKAFPALFGSRRELESVDVMCVVFNSGSMESLERAERVYEGIQAKSSVVKIPVVFVSCRAKAGAEDLPEVVEACSEFCATHALAAPVQVSPRDDDFGGLYADLVGVCLHPNVACPDYYDDDDGAQSSAAMSALKVIGVAVAIGAAGYAAKVAYDYFNKPSNAAAS